MNRLFIFTVIITLNLYSIAQSNIPAEIIAGKVLGAYQIDSIYDCKRPNKDSSVKIGFNKLSSSKYNNFFPKSSKEYNFPKGLNTFHYVYKNNANNKLLSGGAVSMIYFNEKDGHWWFSGLYSNNSKKYYLIYYQMLNNQDLSKENLVLNSYYFSIPDDEVFNGYIKKLIKIKDDSASILNRSAIGNSSFKIMDDYLLKLLDTNEKARDYIDKVLATVSEGSGTFTEVKYNCQNIKE